VINAAILFSILIVISITVILQIANYERGFTDLMGLYGIDADWNSDGDRLRPPLSASQSPKRTESTNQVG
jgi:hypothetical protein